MANSELEHGSSTVATIAALTHFIHRFFLPILLLSYIAAGLAPAIGLALRQITFGKVALPGLGETNLALPLVMLSMLLFNAGMGIQTKELAGIRKRPQLLLVGFLANMLVPIILIVSLRGVMDLWHSSDELQNLLVGLAMIVAMPIAGSSAAWAQNANGNIGLSLGLVLSSTMLSPITTPMVLHFFGTITSGDYSSDLHELGQQGTNGFLCLTAVIPSLAGMATHAILGGERVKHIRPFMKLSNFIILFLLNYSNASTSLPAVFAKPDWDLLALIIFSTAVVCSVAFFSGWLISKLFKTDQADRAALMFSLGMNNNGTGLVLAAAALADHPDVLLPMISYTLVQQVIAAVVDSRMFKAED